MVFFHALSRAILHECKQYLLHSLWTGATTPRCPRHFDPLDAVIDFRGRVVGVAASPCSRFLYVTYRREIGKSLEPVEPVVAWHLSRIVRESVAVSLSSFL